MAGKGMQQRHGDIQTALNGAMTTHVIKSYLFDATTGRYTVILPGDVVRNWGMQTTEAFIDGLVAMAARVGARL